MRRFENIIENYGAALSRVAAAYEADPSLQEDLLQDILLALHRSLPALQDPEKLTPFVFRVAHNRGVSHVVRQKNAKRRPTDDIPTSTDDTPEELLISAERARRVAAAVRSLPMPYRQVMALLLEELSYAQIADALGISVSNVGARASRAKVLLKERLNG